MSHAPPWAKVKHDVEVWRKVTLGDRPPVSARDRACAPVGWCDLMQQCWLHDPASRPSFKDVCRDLHKMHMDHTNQEATTAIKEGAALPLCPLANKEPPRPVQLDSTRTSIASEGNDNPEMYYSALDIVDEHCDELQLI
jgi:hypothetical protein